MRVLLTGASGFVGSHCARVLADAGHDVFGIDREPPSFVRDIHAFHECDVRDRKSLTEAVAGIAPDAIVHAAAITPGDDERQRALEIVEVNQLSTLALLLSAAQAGCRRFVYLSSAAVYADPGPGTHLNERSRLADPGGLYAQTKLASERHCRWAQVELGISTMALRVGPVYGEHERPTDSRQRMSAVYRVIELASSKHDIICNDPDTIYNWVHADDVGRAVALLLDGTPPQEAYNLAGPAVTMRRLLDAVVRAVPGTVVRWSRESDGASLSVPSARHSRPISSEALQQDLGFEPSTALVDGLRRLASYRIERERGRG